jgi:hypothetical protein
MFNMIHFNNNKCKNKETFILQHQIIMEIDMYNIHKLEFHIIHMILLNKDIIDKHKRNLLNQLCMILQKLKVFKKV